MKKESSDVIRNQYVSENEFLKSSINRASIGRRSSTKPGMKGSRSREKKENCDVDDSGIEGSSSVTDFIRKLEDGGNDSSGDDDDDDDDDSDDNDISDSDSENNDDSDSDKDEYSDDKDDSVSEELKIDGDDSDDSDNEEIVKNVEKKNNDTRKNKIVHLEDNEEEVGVAVEEDFDSVDGVKYNSRGTYKSIMEEFEDMENKNNDENKNQINNEIKIENAELDVEVEAEVSSSSFIKVFPKGGFEYDKKEKEIDREEDVIDDSIDEESDDEKDENDDELSTEMKIKYEEMDNLMEQKSKSDETESKSYLDSNLEDSDDYLMLHQNNVDDVLKNLLNVFEINVTSKLEKSKEKAVKNVTKNGIKNTKKKSSSSLKNANLESQRDSLLHFEKKEKKKKKAKKSSSRKNKKTSTSITSLEVQNEKNGFVINLFQNILSHKNTIFYFTLAVAMHYFIFSGILKLV